jgi:hypothetical protein
MSRRSHRQAQVVPISVDSAIKASHIADHTHVEARKQRVRSLQSSSGIVITCDDYCRHGWSRPVQSLNRLVEEPLRLAGRILTVKDIASYQENVYLPLGDNPD